MNRKEVIENSDFSVAYNQLTGLHHLLDKAFLQQFDRSLPFNDELLDRWERAKKLNFGVGSSIYDSSYVFGNVKVGEKTWIGPFTIIDGSGGLSIGSNCTISSGTHIYTHDNVAQTITGGKATIERDPVAIGNCVYIGPNVIIKKGISIGDQCIIGATSFVNCDIPANSIAVGTPVKIIGKTSIQNDQLIIEYFKKEKSPFV